MRKKRVRRKLISVYLPEPGQGNLSALDELSEVGEALDRATSNVAAEMIISDFPRFKDRHNIGQKQFETEKIRLRFPRSQ